jgi:hypothetical protein
MMREPREWTPVPKTPPSTALHTVAERPIYVSLATAARAAGFVVTASQVHRWVRDELLPPTAKQVSRGRRGFETQPANGVAEQLRAVCAWRHSTKRHHELAVLLWWGGWVIPTARIRRALAAWAPKTRPDTSTRIKREELREQIDQMALKFAPRLKARFGRRGLETEAIADAVLPVLERVAGLPTRVRTKDARVIERITGIDRARRDKVTDAGPWLHDRPVAAYDLLGNISMTNARDVIDGASDAALAAARSRLSIFLSAGPAIATRLGEAGDHEFAACTSWGLCHCAEPSKRCSWCCGSTVLG